MSGQQQRVLDYLKADGKLCTPWQISEALYGEYPGRGGRSPGGVTQSLKALEAAGFVKRDGTYWRAA